jgi:hypothetical protein
VSSGVGVVILIAGIVLPALPAYVIGKRRNVEAAWVAFIPVLGWTVVLLWSIDRSGWLCILSLIPFVNLLFSIWLGFTLPAEHGRTRWWGVALVFLPVIGYYIYAFTLDDRSTSVAATA